MLMHLFGFLEDDVLGRVVVASSDQTVGALAQQLCAWVWIWDNVPRPAQLSVENESGRQLDPGSTVEGAGLAGGDIFKVRRAV
jgi:hypothetical protein